MHILKLTKQFLAGAVIAVSISFAPCHETIAQEVAGPLDPFDDDDLNLAARQGPNTLVEWAKKVRGLVQNELEAIDLLCSLTDEQRQALVDLAEQEWYSKTSSAIQIIMQGQQAGYVDLDGVVEKSVMDWCERALGGSQKDVYQQELLSRFELRKKAVVREMAESVDKRVGLSSEQISAIEQAISEKWKDRWYRSLDALLVGSRSGMDETPEVRLTWISQILTESQRQSFPFKPQLQGQVRFFQVPGEPVEFALALPVLELKDRFRLNTVESSKEIVVGEEAIKKASPRKRRSPPQAAPQPLFGPEDKLK